MRQLLRIGLQWNTQVTLPNCQHLVSQAYCSALPIAYSPHPAELWADLTKFVLEAAYEATLRSEILNAKANGRNKVFLAPQTPLGLFKGTFLWINLGDMKPK